MTLALVPPPPRTVVDLAPGLHYGVAPEVYYARAPGLLRKSVLDLVRRSPAHVKLWLDGEDGGPMAAMRFGNVFHPAVLEPARFARDFAIAPDFGDRRYKGPKEAWERWQVENAGKTILDPDDAKAIRGMVAACRAHELLGRILRYPGRAEVTVRWDDAESGLPAAARLDWYVEELGLVVDLKSTEDARPGPFARSVASYRYHVQEAHYRAGLAAVGKPCEHFVLAAIEKRPPYLVALYKLDEYAVERGERSRRRDIRRLEESAVRNVWPGYDERILSLELPRWAED